MEKNSFALKDRDGGHDTAKFCYKCSKCALEFAVYTNYPDDWELRIPFCPECGHQ